MLPQQKNRTDAYLEFEGEVEEVVAPSEERQRQSEKYMGPTPSDAIVMSAAGVGTIVLLCAVGIIAGVYCRHRKPIARAKDAVPVFVTKDSQPAPPSELIQTAI